LEGRFHTADVHEDLRGITGPDHGAGLVAHTLQHWQSIEYEVVVEWPKGSVETLHA
jgi:hypothetical protein